MTRFHYALFISFLFSSLQCKKDCGEQVPECPACNFTCLDAGTSAEWTNDCKDNWLCNYSLQENASIDYSSDDFNADIKDGNKLVFNARLRTEGSAQIADDEFTLLLFFEIDSVQDSFSAESADLDLLNLRYQRGCYCTDTRFKKPSGCMQGQRIDATHWRVQANLTAEYDSWTDEVKLDAVFEL